MEIKLYQINSDRDRDNVAFLCYTDIEKVQGTDEIISELYDQVFEGSLEAKNLEDIFVKFSVGEERYSPSYMGRSMSVSDVVEVISGGEEEPGFYYCDNLGFEKIMFNPYKTQRLDPPDSFRVLQIDPKKPPAIVDMPKELPAMQNAVGGLIEVFYPFGNDTCIVCNDEGKINNMEPNRTIFDQDGKTVIDIIHGPFFICDGSGDDFKSLSPEDIKKYGDMFKDPEYFVTINGQPMTIKVPENLTNKTFDIGGR